MIWVCKYHANKMSLAGAWKQLRWSSDCGQGPENCSSRTDQQWQKPGGGRTCWVGDVVRAVDFAQRNGDVSGWTVGRATSVITYLNSCLIQHVAARHGRSAISISVCLIYFYYYCAVNVWMTLKWLYMCQYAAKKLLSLAAWLSG